MVIGLEQRVVCVGVRLRMPIAPQPLSTSCDTGDEGEKPRVCNHSAARALARPPAKLT